MSSSYSSNYELVGSSGPQLNVRALPPRRLLKRGVRQLKEFGPWGRFIWGHYGKPGATLSGIFLR